MPRTRSAHCPARPIAIAATLALGVALVTCPAARAAASTPRRLVVGYRTRPRPPAPLSSRIRIAAQIAFGSAQRRPVDPVTRTRVVGVPAGESVRAALGRLRRRAGVVYAEPDYVAHAAGTFYPDDRGAARVDHGWERQQWNLLPGHGVDAPEAWSNLLDVGRAGGRGVTIAVLDTGVAYRNWHQFHVSPDLRGTRFVHPYDFVAHNRYPLDRVGHGTLVASIIAESTNNRIGLTGLAYGASIMPLRVLDAQSDGDASTIAEGIRYATDHGANIINLSLEFIPTQVHSAQQIPEVVSAVRYARRHGVMVVAASGNDDARRIAYPAAIPGVVAVGATTKDGCLASYSNSGHGLALVAPGGGEDALLPHDPACHPERTLPPIYQLTISRAPDWSSFGYPGHYIGTSMSAPEVSATAALVIASHVIGTHPTPTQVLRRLEQTATPLPLGARRPNATYGYGLLDAGAATAPPSVAR